MKIKEDKGEPILVRIWWALKSFQYGQVEGTDEIPTEVLKSMGEIGENRLFQLICKMYETDDTSLNFQKSVIYTIS